MYNGCSTISHTQFANWQPGKFHLWTISCCQYPCPSSYTTCSYNVFALLKRAIYTPPSKDPLQILSKLKRFNAKKCLSLTPPVLSLLFPLITPLPPISLLLRRKIVVRIYVSDLGQVYTKLIRNSVCSVSVINAPII